MSDKVLTQAGTNEVEMLIFGVGDTRYAVNVAKVREIVQKPPASPMPNAPRGVEGLIRLRDETLPLVNMRQVLNSGGEPPPEREQIVIILELNAHYYGALVDRVDSIQRMGWDRVEPPPSGISEYAESPLTAICTIDNQIVQILDFERILAGLFGIEQDLNRVEMSDIRGIRDHVRILVAEDSSVIRNSLVQMLKKAGFTSIVACADGQEAWETVEKRGANSDRPFDLILTDIEMPRMDGLHLTSRLKSGRYKAIPVVLFSSIISEGNANKGIQVGADAQITKFQTSTLLEAIDECLAKNQAAA